MNYTIKKNENPWKKARHFKDNRLKNNLIILGIILFFIAFFNMNYLETTETKQLEMITSETFYKPYVSLKDIRTLQDFYDYEESLIYHIANVRCDLVEIMIDIDNNNHNTNHPCYGYIKYVTSLDSYAKLRDYILVYKTDISEERLRLNFIKDLKEYEERMRNGKEETYYPV